MEKKKTFISHRVLALFLVLVLMAGFLFVVPTRAADTGALGKLVDYFQANTHSFTLDGLSRIFLTVEPTGELLQTVQLAQRQFAADGIPTSTPMDIVWSAQEMPRAGDILVQLVSGDNDIGPEGYKITVTSYATVIAEDVDGLLYGLNALQKHFRAAKSTTIKGFTTYDTPDTKERVVSLDCARKYLTKDWICNYIKEMSWMGYNTLQLHFSEDSGFRVDLWDPAFFKDYNGDGTVYHPKNDFRWICGGHPTSWTHNSTLTGINYADYPDKNMFLSTAEVVEILQTCKEYHIDVIPSFDTPAHVDYLTWRFEKYYNNGNNNFSFESTYDGQTYYASSVNGCINYTNKTGYSIPQWPHYTSINIKSNLAKAFIMELYIDIANFFQEYSGSTEFSIGADEVNMSYNTTWAYSDFINYINDLNRLLNNNGYNVRMYNDFMKTDQLSKFDANIKVLYWNSPYNSINGASNDYAVPSVSAIANNNRVMYNCINQHTYYVLRINDTYGDARSKTCYQWEFYGADEQSIYNDWTPNNIRKKGKYIEPDAIVSNDKLAGAYFLVWSDYAMVSTEQQMWNGVYDNAKKTGEFYSLLDRMWSNITKMWNWDIKNTLSYTDFATIRDSLGDLPGLGIGQNACSTKNTLPVGTDPIHLANHTALSEKLANKIQKGDYSDKTYAVYETAYNNAVAVNNNNKATDKELSAALTNLENAEKQLAIKTNTFTITSKTSINGATYVVDTQIYNLPTSQSEFNLFLPKKSGFTFLSVEGAIFTPSESGDGSGYLSGVAVSDKEIVVWYEHNTDASRLYDLLEEAITEQGKFTSKSWAAYATALQNARNFKLSVTTLQSEVDSLVKALDDARTALVTVSSTTSIFAELMTDNFNNPDPITQTIPVGLHVKTTPNIPELIVTNKITGEEVVLDRYSGEVQTLTNGETVKYWTLFFSVDGPGTYIFTVSYNNVSTDVTFTIN
jgi:hypothetical protein